MHHAVAADRQRTLSYFLRRVAALASIGPARPLTPLRAAVLQELQSFLDVGLRYESLLLISRREHCEAEQVKVWAHHMLHNPHTHCTILIH
jgi:hypothetical protein